ncbi:hypothetical protein [Telluribacter sp. SYSU D00476]|uniref:hypothetical protein n=1 Tax=Telluribacter sp. SYSU D00476 TaxID=2811430 RepID=UPI001FF1EB3B|nr:hypothetical protein [Telluribacter sp. SYSU D00476]
MIYPLLYLITYLYPTVAPSSPATAQELTHTYSAADSTYRTLHIQGYKVLVREEAFAHPETQEALAMLDAKLVEVNQLVKPAQLKLLKQVPIWMEWELLPKGAMWYHRSGDWLKANGYMPEKAKSVEVSNIRNFVDWQKLNQPYMVLHELAHAYFDLTIHPQTNEVDKVYHNAVKSRKYDEVAYNLGGTRRAYALNSVDEYFAELSEAYLGQNDYYPFNREQLREFDPEGYQLMKKYWE